ncbi:MAG: hypothetical protein ACREXR_08990, partial [Gammaproteobacteria bacterium]
KVLRRQDEGHMASFCWEKAWKRNVVRPFEFIMPFSLGGRAAGVRAVRDVGRPVRGHLGTDRGQPLLSKLGVRRG